MVSNFQAEHNLCQTGEKSFFLQKTDTRQRQTDIKTNTDRHKDKYRQIQRQIQTDTKRSTDTRQIQRKIQTPDRYKDKYRRIQRQIHTDTKTETEENTQDLIGIVIFSGEQFSGRA